MTSKQFEKFSPAEKRVAIAKDIIDQIGKNRYHPEIGCYIDDDCLRHECDLGFEEDIKGNFTKIKDCRVCQIGAIILSTTKFRNKLKVVDVDRSIGLMDISKINSILGDIFSPYQLLLIETAFEGYEPDAHRYGKSINPDAHLELSDNDIERVDDFNFKHSNDEKRMIAICKNIIKNKGEFIP